MAKALPRGIRNNNPGNIILGNDKWQGLAPVQTDSKFCTFTDPIWGIRALARLLINYQDKYGLNTVKGIINRWAPPKENDTGAYVRAVLKTMAQAGLTGLSAETPIDLHRYPYCFAIVSAIIRHENGAGDVATLNEWYKDDKVNEALHRAGVVKTDKKVVTTETVSAAGAGVVGIDQLGSVVPAVTQAITTSRDDLTSGDWSRIIIGVIMVGAAIALAYSHYRKQKLATA